MDLERNQWRNRGFRNAAVKGFHRGVGRKEWRERERERECCIVDSVLTEAALTIWQCVNDKKFFRLCFLFCLNPLMVAGVSANRFVSFSEYHSSFNR